MEKIIEKIDSYNIFTNLIPGFLLLIFNMYYFNLQKLELGEQIIIAYFAGQTLNRLGSIFTGKILLKISKEKGETYDKYIKACKIDEKINILLLERNTFRTLCTLLLVCIIEILCSKIVSVFNISIDIIIVFILLLLIVVYSTSFCKYNKYISERVRNSDKESKRKNR